MLSPDRPYGCSSPTNGSLRKLEELEVEQDSLNHSLLALTSHFAQVQFRLKQIVESDAADRDSLLKELERFAFDGCQDLPSYDNVHDSICSTFEKRLAEQKAKHEELIFQLKFQLKDLEHYAKQTSEVKAHEQIRRHKLVLDQIKNYLKIDISDLYTLPPDQLQEKVDAAVQDIMAPMRSKEQMLHQLTTQVQDLERFIEFLHGTGKTPNAVSHEIRRCTCDCPLHGEPARAVAEPRSKVLRKEGIEFLSKTLLMFQVIVINSLRMIGCQWQVPEKVPSFMHQVRRLEESVDNFLRFYNNAPHSDEYQEVLLDMVRKKISLHLKVLLGHGLKSAKSRDSFALVSCASKARGHAKASHPWSMLTEFYSLQHGKSFTEQPQYQLSQSFGLRIQRESINSKQSLLSCIHKVRESHEPYKRSSNAKFKALIAHGINDGALAQWIRILATSDTLLQLSYEPWSYMTNHGFKEGIKILERLSQVKCNIPTDVALRMFYIPSGTETPLE